MNKPGTPPGFHRVLALIAVEVHGWMEHQIGTFPWCSLMFTSRYLQHPQAIQLIQQSVQAATSAK